MLNSVIKVRDALILSGMRKDLVTNYKATTSNEIWPVVMSQSNQFLITVDMVKFGFPY